jgi:hypothetical protein
MSTPGDRLFRIADDKKTRIKRTRMTATLESISILRRCAMEKAIANEKMTAKNSGKYVTLFGRIWSFSASQSMQKIQVAIA